MGLSKEPKLTTIFDLMMVLHFISQSNSWVVHFVTGKAIEPYCQSIFLNCDIHVISSQISLQHLNDNVICLAACLISY